MLRRTASDSFTLPTEVGAEFTIRLRVRLPTTSNAACMKLIAALCFLVVLPGMVLAQQAPQPTASKDIPVEFGDWLEPTEPLHIAGPIHYVGTRGIGVYLITTPEGHILIDGGMPAGHSAAGRGLIRKSGFKPEDVRWLLVSHAHFDHVGSLAALKKLTGASVAAMTGDDGLLKSGGKTDYVFADKPRLHFDPVTVDRVLKDGDTVSLGGITLIARHARPYSWQCLVAHDDRRRRAVLSGGVLRQRIGQSGHAAGAQSFVSWDPRGLPALARHARFAEARYLSRGARDVLRFRRETRACCHRGYQGVDRSGGIQAADCDPAGRVRSVGGQRNRRGIGGEAVDAKGQGERVSARLRPGGTGGSPVDAGGPPASLLAVWQDPTMNPPRARSLREKMFPASRRKRLASGQFHPGLAARRSRKAHCLSARG